VYDPLINWRLLSGSNLTPSSTSTGVPLTTLPSLEFGDPNDAHPIGSVSSLWSSSASSHNGTSHAFNEYFLAPCYFNLPFLAASVVSRGLGPISYSPSPARQTSLSLRTTNMAPNARPPTNTTTVDAPPRRPQVRKEPLLLLLFVLPVSFSQVLVKISSLCCGSM
jgi:hypothetical protein